MTVGMNIWVDSSTPWAELVEFVFSKIETQSYFQLAKTDDVMCFLGCTAERKCVLRILTLPSQISHDTSHVLHSESQLMPSGWQ